MCSAKGFLVQQRHGKVTVSCYVNQATIVSWTPFPTARIFIVYEVCNATSKHTTFLRFFKLFARGELANEHSFEVANLWGTREDKVLDSSLLQKSKSKAWKNRYIVD